LKKNKLSPIIITIIIFIFILALRLPTISNNPVEIGDMWRQADTESIARNFTQDKFNILYPQFNYDGPLPNYIQLEFQITTYIIAILYNIFGHSYTIARAVSLFFFMLSTLYLFLIGKKIYNTKTANIIIIIYGLIPINLFYSRAIMPESALLFFFLGSYYHFLKWLDDESWLHIILSALMTALAISQKTPAIFIGIPMLLLALGKFKLKVFNKLQLWVFGVLSLVPPFLYIIWSGKIAEFTFVSNIADKHILPKMFLSLKAPETWLFFEDSLPEEFTILLLVLSSIGLLTLFTKKELPILLLTLAMIVETLLIVSIIKLEYYMIFLAPIVALLSGKTIYFINDKLFRGKYRNLFFNVIIGSFIIFLGFTTSKIVEPKFEEVSPTINFAQFIDDNTQRGDLIVIGYLDPARLSLSNRQGWRANLNYYDYIPTGAKDEINYYVENGATHFIVHKNYIYGDKNYEYINYLNENFKKESFPDGYAIYYLSENPIQ